MSTHDLSNSVIIPRDDFLELEAAAYTAPPKTVGDRAAATVQTTLWFAAAAAAVTAGSWGWAKAVDFRERRQHERQMATMQWKIDNDLVKKPN